ncbi:peptidoglycan-binding protein [Eubacteriales bacterium OttesenSCG-928-N13]|nr:peptidoglycan-binding protein [Eubacteriales bacterium OttesenSCG-928-N13]
MTKKQENINEEIERKSEEKTPAASGWGASRAMKRTYPAMSGDDVRGLQEALIASGYACGRSANDGIFGDDTRKAVRAFQGSHKLTVNGIAGKDTVTALGGTWNK